jgi:uracil-DNA glycosylase
VAAPATDHARAADLAALAWQLELGADEAIGDAPVDRFALEARPPAAPGTTPPVTSPVTPPVGPPSAAAAAPEAMTAGAATGSAQADADGAAALAAGCADLAALRSALEGCEGSALRRGARRLVFADGLPGARVMVVGEAPGREEDAAGRPFVGRSGQLLDRMLAAIGLSRAAEAPEGAVYITNVLPWRPPANRDPSGDEIAMLKPFLFRHIELAAPEVLVLMGSAAARVVLERQDGIMRLRGRWTEWRGLPVMPMIHPASLLRDGSRKRAAWADLLAIRARLDGEAG